MATEDLPTLGFTIKSCTVGKDPVSGKDITAGALVWGEDSARSIRDAFAEAGVPAKPKTARASAADWLHEYLTEAGGKAARADIVKAGEEAGHTLRTLQRAHKTLSLVTDKGFQGAATWALPDES